MTVAENLEEIESSIEEICHRSGRNRNDVHIVAVTKYVSVERAKEAIEAGVLHIGENRIESLLEKRMNLKHKDVKWHFIGTLQTRKVRAVLDAEVDYIHSLDRMSLAEEIQKRSSKPVNCFIQVNTSNEESKHGLTIEDTIPFIQALKDFPNIQVVGLMTMAPNTHQEEILRNTFRNLRLLKERVQALELSYAPCHELSMGMSNDYKIAVEEGSTFIRIGTSLVG